MPVLLGLGVAGGFYRVFGEKLKGKPLKVHTIGLTIGAFSGMQKYQNIRRDRILLLSPILINLMILAFKDYRVSSKYLLSCSVAQVVAMRLLASWIIYSKKEAVYRHVEDLKENLWRREDLLGEMINGLAYQKDVDEVKVILRRESAALLQRPNRISTCTVVDAFDDPDKKFRLLLDHNIPASMPYDQANMIFQMYNETVQNTSSPRDNREALDDAIVAYCQSVESKLKNCFSRGDLEDYCARIDSIVGFISVEEKKLLAFEEIDRKKVDFCKKNQGKLGIIENVARTIRSDRGKVDFCNKMSCYRYYQTLVEEVAGECSEALQVIATYHLDQAEQLLEHCGEQARYDICKSMLKHPRYHDALERIAQTLSQEKKEEILQQLAINNVDKAEGLLQYCCENAKTQILMAMSRYPEHQESVLRIGGAIQDRNRKLEVMIILAKNAARLIEGILETCNQRGHNYSDEELAPLHFIYNKNRPLSGRTIVIPPQRWNRSCRVNWEAVNELFKSIFNANPSSIRSVKISGKKKLMVGLISGEVSVDLPFSVKLLTIGQMQHLVLVPKEIIGKGGEKEVKLAYNLTAGEFYAKKEVQPEEMIVFNALRAPPYQGLPRYVFNTEKNGKSHLYQPLYDCDIERAISTGLFRSRESRLFVIRKILEALVNFHQHMITGLHYKDDESVDRVIPPFPAMHADIKPGNIVIDQETLEVMLIDLGISTRLDRLSGSIYYLDPHAMGRPFGTSKREWVEYHRRLGQKRDVWGAGLVIAGILFGFDEGLPKLPFIKRCRPRFPKCYGMRIHNLFGPNFENDEQEITYKVSRISDYSIQEFFDNMGTTEEPLVGLLKGMLRVDPEERFTSEQSLREFQSIFI